jgi:hypothetical protein
MGTTGYSVVLAVSNSNDGVGGMIPASAGFYPGFIGMARNDIAANDYGLVQIAGFVNSVFLGNVGTSNTVNAGDPVVLAPGGFASAAPTYANSAFGWLFASNVSAAVSA